MNTRERLWQTDNQWLNVELELVFDKLYEIGFSDMAERNYWQGRLDALASVERARKQNLI